MNVGQRSRTRSGTQLPYPSNTKPRTPVKSKQEKLDDKAQLYLENIYTDINSLWRQACEFPATFKLLNFSGILQSPGQHGPKHFTEAQRVLGEALLCISLRSESFLRLLEENSASSEEVLGVLLKLIKDSETSLGQFAITRNLDWFKDSPFTDIVVPACWACPPKMHPHEVYRADDDSLKRCLFRDDHGSCYEMQNITDNIYDEKNWRSNLPKPKHWPEWQPFPGDPSICPPDGYGPNALCHGGCGQRSGISQSACPCVAEKTYIHALVEIVQMASWKPGELNRGVRAVARIKKSGYGTSVECSFRMTSKASHNMLTRHIASNENLHLTSTPRLATSWTMN
jgi:hypothetical protein